MARGVSGQTPLDCVCAMVEGTGGVPHEIAQRRGLSPKSRYRAVWARSRLGVGCRECGVGRRVQGECDGLDIHGD
jgi:hypothetical protein